MFFHDKLEERIQADENKMQQLGIRLESIERDVIKFLSELPVTVEQLNEVLSNPDNFCTEEWEELQSIKTQLDDRLQRELENIRNPLKVKKTFTERNVQQHWLYVR